MESNDAGEKVKSALAQHFRDLNLLQPELAPVLKRVVLSPYARVQSGCDTIGAEIRELDAVLGLDLDAAEPSLKTKAVHDAFEGARDAASSFVPYRGAVRLVTGAEEHDREVNKAVLAGEIRRGYLKGIAQERGCSQRGAEISQAN